MTDQTPRTDRRAKAPRASESPLRLSISLPEAERLSARLLHERSAPSVALLRELLWLRAVFIEQWRRTPKSERERFSKRADSLLERLRLCRSVRPAAGIPWSAMTNHETDERSLMLSVKEAAGALGISVSGVYRLIDAGDLHRIKVGSRTLFERRELERYVADRRAAGAHEHAETEESKLAVLLLSGGLDSTTTLAIAQDLGYRTAAISFRYGQRHSLELEAAQAIARRAGVEQHVIVDIDLAKFGGSALTADIDVPKSRSVEEMGDGIPATYVPARNTVFLSFALAWAEVLGADDIFLGVNALDYSGYPDCRPEYIAAFERMANLATKRAVEGQRLRIHAPLIALSKAEIIQRGLQLGVDHSLTRSCYDPTPAGAACGECDSCLLRLKGFAENGIEDPAPYRATPIAA